MKTPANLEDRLRDALHAYTELGRLDERFGAVEERARRRRDVVRRRRWSVGVVVPAAAIAAVVGISLHFRAFGRTEVRAGLPPPTRAVPAGHDRDITAVTEDGRVVLLDGGDGRVRRTIAPADPGRSDESARITANGAVVAVGHRSGTTCGQETVAFPRTDHATYSVVGHDPAFSADGHRYAWVSGFDTCGSVVLHSRDLVAKTEKVWASAGPALSPDIFDVSFLRDGHTLAFIEQGQEESPAALFTLDTDRAAGPLARAVRPVHLPPGVLRSATSASAPDQVFVALGEATTTTVLTVNVATGVTTPAFAVNQIVGRLAADATRVLFIVATYGTAPDGHAVEHDALWLWRGPGSQPALFADGIRAAVF